MEDWAPALTGLGGRNTLLSFKDRRSGTLDLAQADPAALEHLLTTGSIRLTKLFRDVDIRADAIRRIQVIYRKARELLEERGIRAGYLAVGMARWDELFLQPAAPVLLRGLTITPPRARHDDFDLLVDDEPEVNPVLLHKLTTVYGAATDKLADLRGDRLYRALTAVAEAAEVPGFAIIDRKVIGTFTYAKLPMVRDIQNAAELLADSDVVAAIAGDPEAQELLSADDAAAPVLDSPDADYSVLDADSSQRSAIAAVLSGHSLVIHGPPGTGKSQTIANLTAALVARGRKVLFVAEKRAAIDAVLSRLKAVDLGELVLDIHEGTRDRQRIAADLGASLDVAQQTTTPDDTSLRRRLAERQRRLSDHVTALHEAHPPWGLTPFAVQSALLRVPEEARNPVRLPAPERITAIEADGIRDELREFAHLGGVTMGPGKPAREELAALLKAAAGQLGDWEWARNVEGTGDRDAGSLPTVPAGLVELAELHADCSRKLDALRARVPLSADDVAGQLSALAADEDTAWKLPRLYELAARFDDLGLAPLLDELGRCEASPDLAAAAFDHAWHSSILDQIKVRDPRYAAERGSALDEVASDFRGRDVEYLKANRRRVRHAWAERLREAQDQHPLQARVIRKQAALRRGHLPLRRLLDQTPDVLFALKPCWAMSPLMVSQVLTPTRLFAAVVFRPC